jgi:pimeloyl-ACP methyl ester carboxylesterase
MRASRVIGAGAVLIVGALAAGPFIARAAVRRPRGQTFDSAGTRLHFTEDGSGPPLILLHGFAVNGDLNWRLPGLVRKLATDFRVITLDLRGHGASEPADLYGAAMAGDVVRLLDHLGLAQAHVAGYSLGGVITLKVATTHPDRLITASMLGSGWERPDTSMFLGAIDEIAAELEAGRGVGPLAEHLGDDRESPGALHRLWVRFMTSFLNEGPALAGVVRGLPELTVDEEELRELAVPVCSIVGSRDPMRVGAEALEGRVPDLRLTVIEGADHLTATSHPLMVSTFAAFLANHTDSQAHSSVVGE